MIIRPTNGMSLRRAIHPEFLAQMETIIALGNGYLGMRGCPEEGGPNAENSTLINGFYETWPIVYGEEAYGFARTGQTICNVTDAKSSSCSWMTNPSGCPSKSAQLRPAPQYEVRDTGSRNSLGDACGQSKC